MRLSLGFVRGDRLACLYHGWQYDAAGRCRFIPAHPQLAPPETIRVTAYDAIEWLGMIWVWPEGPEKGERPPHRDVTPVRSITIECVPARASSYLASLPRPAGAIATEDVGPTSLLTAVGHDGEDVLVGMQPLSDGACVLHLVLPRGSSGLPQKRASAWAEAVRDELEQSLAGTTEAR